MAKQKNIPPDDIIEHLRVGVCRMTPSAADRFWFVNPAMAHMLGYAPAEISRMRPSKIFVTVRQWKALSAKILKSGSVENEEVQFRKKGGQTIWCAMTATVVPGGKCFDVMLQDITAHKQVERELLESRELFRLVFDNSAVAITVADKEEKIIAWNPFAEQLLGMNKEDLFNKSVRELYPAKEWRRLRSLRIRKKGLLTNLDTKIFKKEGGIIDVSMSISVLRDLKGNINGTIGILRDITREKAIERKLRESENKTRIILDNSAAAITLTDKDERIVSWNKYTEHLLGMKRKDLYMKHVSCLYPPEEWENIRRENIRHIGSRQHLETKVVRKGGDVIDIDLSIKILKDSQNNIIGSVGIMQDMTEYRKAKEMLLEAKVAAEEASSAKSQFLANMSHEVRTPMNAIVGMIDMTLDTPLNDEQKDNLNTAKEAAENLLNLLNDILDLSRVESGKMRMEEIEINVANIIKSICKGLSVLARNKNLELGWQILPDVPYLILGDPVRLRQVIINLVNNAIKFTPQGKIEIIVQSVASSGPEHAQPQDVCELQFSVKDTGIGIPKEKLNTVFEVFTQADDSVTRKYGGTGLGLAISKRLVEMMGGRIWVESNLHQGSVFSFTATFKIKQKSAPDLDAGHHPKLSPISLDPLPAVEKSVAPQSEAGPVAEVTAKSAEYPPGLTLRVLLAEDNLVNRKIAVKMLEKRGWTVLVAENGLETVKIFESGDVDIILMDVQMPLMDGYMATQRIREIESPKGRHIPIIALTAHAMEGDEQKCLNAGMDGYVSKPIDRAKLFDLIDHLIKKGQTCQKR